MKITIANSSPTLHPGINVYDANKTEITSARNTTAGGNLVLDINSDAGDYTLTVMPQFLAR